MQTSAVRKFLFIINPNAGRKKAIDYPQLIRSVFAEELCEIVVWKDRNHFSQIRQEIGKGDHTHIIAVGGDGTVNQIAAEVSDTGKCLGVLPAGSGNGYARSVGLEMDPLKALKQLRECLTEKVDYGLVNGKPFFCTAGVGFDAHIGTLFARSVRRGLRSYIRIIMRELRGYSPQEYTVTIDGKTIERQAFLVTVANAGQYGNNFYIAPEATMQDGLFHIVLIKPLGLHKALGLLIKVLRRKAHTHSCVETHVGRSVRISRTEPGPVHYDGEPAMDENVVNFEMRSSALVTIVGKRFIALSKQSLSKHAQIR